MMIDCAYNDTDALTKMNRCRHPAAPASVGLFPDAAVCRYCLQHTNGNPGALFSAAKSAEPAPAPNVRKAVIDCAYLGTMLEACSCNDGGMDRFVCNYPDFRVNGHAAETLRKMCAACKHNAAAQSPAK